MSRRWTFQAAHAAGLAGLADPDVLAAAAQEGRLLVTHDMKTMPYHFADFTAAETSAGVLIVSQRLSISQVVEDLMLIWLATDAEEWRDRIRFLPL